MALSSPPPSAAYIYTLQIDPPGLAWEYLRRDPAYRSACRHRRGNPAQWGMKTFEDPNLDARSADLIWSPNASGQVHLTGDTTGGSQAPFSLWRLKGPRRLFHDGLRMSLTGVSGAFGLRAVLGDHLRDGGPLAYAVSPSETVEAVAAIARFEHAMTVEDGTAHTPSRKAVAHMRAFHALDAIEAGLSERDIGVAMFGPHILADWHSESPVRAGVRDAVRRGRR